MDKLTFINPSTGEHFLVAPSRKAVELAERLGYLPIDEESWDAAEMIMGRSGNAL